MTESALDGVVDALPPVAIAVSGGVDSLTLAAFIHLRRGRSTTQMIHAASAAVPAEATTRVHTLAATQDWDLQVIDAGEFADPRYRANPVDRCFFCKTNLYGAIATRTDRLILSGANLDDLGDYRPGLKAAASAGVRHPYVEAGYGKADVRALARRLGLGDVADLPASPCLSSRMETGLAIDPAMLAMIDRIERMTSQATRAKTVRCRIRKRGLVVELDADALSRLTDAQRLDMQAHISREASSHMLTSPIISFEPYQMGGAFLRALS